MKALFLLLSLILAPYGRTGLSLNGEWSAIVDQYDKGMAKGMYMDALPEGTTEFKEDAYDGGLRLQVPGDWNHQNPGLWWYEGTLWYGRHFEAERHPGRRRILYFSGVSHRCEVFLNGVSVVCHEGAFTPFEADVTDLLRDGDNFLAVKVNNTRRADTIPAMSFDWWNYGGITRDVMLLEVPDLYVRDGFVRLAKGSKDRIQADISLSEAKAGIPVTISIPELKIRGTLLTDTSGSVRATLKARNLRLWAPLTPKRYEVTVTAAEDTVLLQVGFREIAVKGTQVLVNGAPVFLKSISFHEEIPMEKRRAYSEEDARRLVDAALALGCNTIRLAHYPQNVHIVDYAEEKGLLIWEEIPLWQGIDFSSDETYRRAEIRI